MIGRGLPVLLALLLLAADFGRARAGAPPESPHARFARAGRLMATGELEKAYAILEKLADDYPQRWGERARRKMQDLKKIVEVREKVRKESARLRAAAGSARGELRPWLLLESARALFSARLHGDALNDATAAAGAKSGSRFRSAALLVVARCELKLGRAAEAEKAYLALLAEKHAPSAERDSAWKELAELISAGKRGEDLRKVLESHIKRGHREPGVHEAVNRYIAESLVGEKESLRLGKVLHGLVKGWPPGSLSPEWVLIAAKVAEFIDRDFVRADKLYRLVLERYPEACFDLTMIRAGRRGADAGREVILAALGRVEKKKKGEIKPLKAPRPKERGDKPESALAAVLCALRSGNPALAGECAAGKLAAELKVKRYPYRTYALSDYRILDAEAAGAEAAEITYEVTGELGVTRVLKRKALAVRKGGVWKVSDLGM